MAEPSGWYIVKNLAGTCDIVTAAEISGGQKTEKVDDTWGPYASKAEAIARRVGLIRAGKCQPL